MAGRLVTKAAITAAAKLYCDRANAKIEGDENKLMFSEGEDGRIRLIKGGVPLPGDISIWEDSGQLRCSDPEFAAMIFRACLDDAAQSSDMPSELARAPHNEARKDRSNVPAVQRNGHDSQGSGQGFDMETWREKQARSYSAAGKQAPNAFAVSEAANTRGFCTQIIDSGRTKELVWGHVRVTDPKTGQFREDRVAHEKDVFCLLKAWEDANSQAKFMAKGVALIVGIQDNNMPELNPDVKIKGMPSGLWLTMALMRAWSFADRDAITKAERRAQLKMLNREWREDDEIVLEQEEERAVQESMT